jgi:hypothetical protein
MKCADKDYICPGYENTINRLFQDESAHVEKKVKRAKAKAVAKREQQDLKDRSEKAVIGIQDSIGSPLLCPLIDRGISFFMTNYALGLEQPPLQSEAYHLHLSTHGFHPVVATSMTALGLAGIANLSTGVSYKPEAMRWYLKALRMTNNALATSSEVRSDNTLLATMMLSMFEATNNDTSLMGWSEHVSGSALLLKIRGIEQFSTPAGRRMFMQTVAMLTMTCFGKGVEIPDFIHEMNKENEKWEDEKNPGDRFYRLQIKTTDFRAHIVKGHITDLHEIVEKALEIDRVAQSTFDDTDEDWSYEVIQTHGKIPGVYGDFYHVYAHISGAQTWNWVRYNRIYLLDIIRNCLLAGFATTPPIFAGNRYLRLLETSTQSLYQMQADILASIPQYLHDTPNTPLPYSIGFAKDQIAHIDPKPSLRTSSSPSQPKYFWSNFREKEPHYPGPPHGTPKDRLPIVRVAGGYSPIWAIYVAAATPIATPESQAFVLKTLDRITHEFGVNQAKVLAGALKMKISLDASGQMPFQLAPRYLPVIGRHFEKFDKGWETQYV